MFSPTGAWGGLAWVHFSRETRCVFAYPQDWLQYINVSQDSIALPVFPLFSITWMWWPCCRHSSTLAMELSQWRASKLNKAVSKNPFLIPVVKSHSPGSHVLTRRRGNFPSSHCNQSTSSQPRGGSTTSNYKGLYAGKLCPVWETSSVSETFTETLWKISGKQTMEQFHPPDKVLKQTS